MTRNSFTKIFLATAISAGCAIGGGLPIGVATAVGSFSVNDLPVSGNTDLADGARLETGSTPSDVHLQSGADVRLSSKSAGAIYSDHAVLERGAMRVEKFDQYPVAARKLQIQADGPASEAVVRLKGNTVEVASLGGSVRVTDGGAMLTHVARGTKMSFQQSATQSGAQTGAQIGRPKVASDEHVLYWLIGITAGAAIAIGSIAAVQGKNPF